MCKMYTTKARDLSRRILAKPFLRPGVSSPSRSYGRVRRPQPDGGAPPGGAPPAATAAARIAPTPDRLW